MKIDHKELQRLYLAHIMKKIPVSRDRCPNLEELIACLRTPRPGKKRNEIVEHIVNCSYCWEEFDFILRTTRAEKALLEQIKTHVPKPGQGRIFRSRPFSKRISFGYASLAFAGMILFLMLVILLKTNLTKPQPREERGRQTSPILLLSPSEMAVASFPLTFRWRESSQADAYVLELFDESLRLVWKSSLVTEPKLVLPQGVASHLVKRKDYFWMVTSFKNEKRLHESSLGRFYLPD